MLPRQSKLPWIIVFLSLLLLADTLLLIVSGLNPARLIPGSIISVCLCITALLIQFRPREENHSEPLSSECTSAALHTPEVIPPPPQDNENEPFASALLQNSAVPTIVIGADHRILIWNRACEQLTGLNAQQMLGTSEQWRPFYREPMPVLADIVLDGSLDNHLQQYTLVARSTFIPEGLQGEGWYRNLNGIDRYIFFNAAPIRDANGTVIAAIETIEDITDRKRYEERLEFQANHDSLTRLPNRTLLSDRIRQGLLFANRNKKNLALFFIDLDQFKYINDSLGHDIGDTLLKMVAERLGSTLRASDTLARYGGDEFIVLIADLTGEDDADIVARKLQQTLLRPFKVYEHELTISCSIGISIFPRDGSDVQTLLRHADIALYQTKELGRGSYIHYNPEMNASAFARIKLEKYLRQALVNNELLLYYQPKINIKLGDMTGLEALIRWQSPAFGLVSPATFIPLAEETGLIVSIGEWVLRTACTQIKSWQRDGLPFMPVAVNLSPRQFLQKDIVTIVQRTLEETGLEACYLELEITESLGMHHMEQTITLMNEMKALGVRLTMDDFGTGYSSLSYLKLFPFDTLKLDKSFIHDITTDMESANIVQAVIHMAHCLNLKVIAEAVETPEQLAYLKEYDCDEIQGFLFSPPLPVIECEQLLRSQQQTQT